MKLKSLLVINWKRFFWVIGLWTASVVLHNLVSGLLGVEEPFFFLLAVIVLPVYLVVAIVYSLIIKKKH